MSQENLENRKFAPKRISTFKIIVVHNILYSLFILKKKDVAESCYTYPRLIIHHLPRAHLHNLLIKVTSNSHFFVVNKKLGRFPEDIVLRASLR